MSDSAERAREFRHIVEMQRILRDLRPCICGYDRAKVHWQPGGPMSLQCKRCNRIVLGPGEDQEKALTLAIVRWNEAALEAVSV